MSPMLPVQITTKQQAYRTAAWVELMGSVLPDDGSGDDFETIRDAVSNT